VEQVSRHAAVGNSGQEVCTNAPMEEACVAKMKA
jgi:hypothetical protein